MKSLIIIPVIVATIIVFACGGFWLCHLTRTKDYDFNNAFAHENRTSERIQGRFELKVDKPFNPTITVMYKIPLDSESGKLRKNASKFIFYSPYCGDENRLENGFIAWHRDFADIYGYSIFTVSIATNWDMIDDRNLYYIYSENGWPEIIFQIHEQLRKRFNLKKEQLYIVGESSGASFAQQIVARFPEKVAKAALHGGSKYADFKPNTRTKILCTSTWGDAGAYLTQLMYEDAKRKGIDITFLETPPSPHTTSSQYRHHAGWELNYNLMTAFITDIDFDEMRKIIPKVDFSKQPYYVFPSPEKPVELTLLKVDFDKNEKERRIQLQDKLWELYNKRAISAFINIRYVKEQDIDSTINLIKRQSNARNLRCNIIEYSLL